MKLRLLPFLLAALLCAVLAPAARAFDPAANGNVYATAVQTDGAVVIGGNFTAVQPSGDALPVERDRLARFNADGSVDPAFDLRLDGDVTALALQSDGKILVGGRFTQAQVGAGGAIYARAGLLRVNADGTLDSGFDPRAVGGSGSSSPVDAIALQADGEILIGGDVTSLQPNGAGAPVAIQHLARLHSDGSVDTGFAPVFNNTVLALAIQTDGRILVGGGFTTFQAPGDAAATTVSRLVRLNPDGSLDGGFSPTADNRVTSLVVQADGAILAGGNFTTVRGTGDSSDSTRYFITRFLADGTLDSGFATDHPTGAVSTIALQHDGRILVGGTFGAMASAAGGTIAQTNLARLNQSGTVDTSFSAKASSTVSAIAVQNDDRIVLGGYFTRITPSSASGSLLRSHVARLLANGDLDGGFGADETGAVLAAAFDGSGNMIIGGSFLTVNGATRTSLARLKADGSLDPNFAPVFDGKVEAVGIQSDGRIVVGGQFSTVDGTACTNLARLNADGTLDTGFHPGPNSSVSAVLVRSDGRILVGGAFTTFDLGDTDTTNDVTRSYLAELDSSGQLTSLALNVTGPVTRIYRQSDGRILIGGSFTAVLGDTHTDIARLTTGNGVESSFNPTPNSAVQSIAVQADGKVVFGGIFSTLQLDDGQNDDDDGDGQTNDDADRLRIARLNADGTLDQSFNPGFNAAVTAIQPLANGSLLVGGSFTRLEAAGLAWNRLVRLNADGSKDAAFDLQTNDRVNGFLQAADGSIYAYGQFTSAYTTAGTSIAATAHLLHLTAAGDIDRSFAVSTSNPAGERVQAIAAEADGRLLVGGSFTSLAGHAFGNLARISASGTPDTTFSPAADGAVDAVVVQPVTASTQAQVNLLAWFQSNGNLQTSFDRTDLANLSGSISTVLLDGDWIVVGGSFVAGNSGIRNLARFSRSGHLDSTFNPAPDGAVAAIARQTDGKLLVGGSFTNIAGTSATPYFARLNADGTADTGFVPPPLNGSVAAIVVQADGQIVAGGTFTATTATDGTQTIRHYLIRYKSDGTIDTYNPYADAAVTALLLLPDGRIIVGGSFTYFTPNLSGTIARNYLALLNADGTVDQTSFNPGPNGAVSAIVRQADGKIVFGGAFTTLALNSADRTYLARLNADFTLDTSFDPKPNSTVQSLAIDGSNRIYVAGTFSAFVPSDGVTYGHEHVARLNADGSVDATFNPTPNGVVHQVAVDSDGSVLIVGAFTDMETEAAIYVGGEFSSVGGVSAPYLARITDNGTADAGYQPSPNGAVLAMAADDSGRIMVGGAFTQLDGTGRSRLARLDNNGGLDAGFSPQFDGTVRALAAGPSGSLVVGGDFSSVNGATHAHLVRLNSSGAVDGSFSVQLDGTVRAVATLPDGRVLVGGDFSSVNGTAHAYLARLQADGSLDSSFNPSPNGAVYALAARTDGTVVAGGDFTQIGGAAHARIAVLQSGGALDASVGTTMNATVRVLAGLSDGSTLAGGDFTSDGTSTNYLVGKLTSTTSSTYTFTVASGLNSVSLALSGAAPVYTSLALAYSTNGNSWTSLGGVGASADGKTWTWSGAASLPSGTPYLLRARAVAPAAGGGSSGVVQAVWQFLNSTPAVTITINQGGTSGSGGSGSGTDSGTIGNTGSSTPARTDVATIYGSGTDASAPGYFSDVATLLRLKGSELQFVNFVIAGSSARRVYLHVAGPGLSAMNVSDGAPSPQFELYTSGGARWLAAAGPVTSSTLISTADQLGALPLTSGSADAAVLTTLSPGAYTLVVWDGSGTGGAVMAELYAADGVVPSRLVAYASRASDAANNGVQATEFTINGTGTRQVLVRALGPALTAQGLTGAMADPQLLLENAAGTTLASNDNWETPVTTGSTAGATAAQVTDATTRAGAAALAAGAKDAAVLVTLSPGTYTAAVSGPSGSAGFSEVEVYEVPAPADTGTSSTTTTTSTSSSSSGGGGGAPSWPAALLLATMLCYRGWRRRRD